MKNEEIAKCAESNVVYAIYQALESVYDVNTKMIEKLTDEPKERFLTRCLSTALMDHVAHIAERENDLYENITDQICDALFKISIDNAGKINKITGRNPVDVIVDCIEDAKERFEEAHDEE